MEAIRVLGERHETVGEDRDAHLYPEMLTFVRRPELHASFIERYNTLGHLRLGMATSLGQ